MSGAAITKLTARPVLVPLVRPITTAVATIPKAPLVLIDIETNAGIVGRSYLFTYTPMAMAPLAKLLDNIGETLIGKAADPVSRMADMEATFRLLGRQGLVAMALAGIDMALWDAAAKALNVSVARMLGAAERAVPCYDSHGIFELTRDRDAVETSLAQGFKAVKFKVGVGDVQQDVDTLRDIRSVIGPDVRLMIDYNQSLTPPEAIRRVKRFEDEGFDLSWVEEPVAAEDFAGHQMVRAGITTPLQTGENWWMPDDAARAIQNGICDHAMIDIMKIGGVTGWMRAAAMAQAASLPISSHLFIEASAHTLAATPNAYLLEYMDVAQGILTEPYVIADGCLTPRGPGLGIAWDEAAVAQYLI